MLFFDVRISISSLCANCALKRKYLSSASVFFNCKILYFDFYTLGGLGRLELEPGFSVWLATLCGLALPSGELSLGTAAAKLKAWSKPHVQPEQRKRESTDSRTPHAPSVPASTYARRRRSRRRCSTFPAGGLSKRAPSCARDFSRPSA